MTTLLRISQIETLAGQSTVLHDINWQQFESILQDLGDKRRSRIAYLNGVLEIALPLPESERIKVLIRDFVQVLMDKMGIDFEGFGSTTFKRIDKLAGLEPDDCFYIQNNVAMRGIRKLDMTIDPPPDLAIEVDVTSKTKFNVYRILGVPELWLYDQSLKIYILRDGEYVESELSPIFGAIPIRDVITQFLEMSLSEGRSKAMKAFRLWMQENLS
ncbi:MULTISPECIES: Uma2 family endonuclease [Pseudanabaena]|uniref:Uma2 family endonuclease n=1 Tax=Pseudanabaena TaxID=1152 RepID=UPI002478752A|nr:MULTISPECIES: Uma2 family endonuclease [Pseudanabaena]MEA5485745.1 Uma2 family endonuclease [Pseudanabaena sp. CCNP1317]WGS72090.1 Uma2 family endonuclease [Pseudanabaena galeata CCNP1313]